MKRTANKYAPVLIAVVAFCIGVGAGWFTEGPIAKARWQSVRAAWAVDLNSRLSMLRLLREYKAPSDKLRPLEVGAVNLLDTMELENSSAGDGVYAVSKNAVQSLRQYSRDFPDTELSPSKHPFIGRILENYQNDKR
jgi:hypothetical protein